MAQKTGVLWTIANKTSPGYLSCPISVIVLRGICSPRVLLTVVMVWLLNCTNWLGHETLLGYPRFPLTGELNVEKDSEDSHDKIKLYVILEITFTLLLSEFHLSRLGV